MHIDNINYAYRLKTFDIFSNMKPVYWDFFMVDDPNFAQHCLFENLWRETLLLHHLDDPRVPKVHSFGQLPNKIIYRQIDEIQGSTL